MKPSVYFRTEGNENTGLGHLFRCLSLAEILQTAFTCIFILSSKTPRDLFEKINFSGAKPVYIDSLTEQQEVSWITSNLPSSSVVVIDSYHFSDEYFSWLVEKGYKTVFIDDQNKINTTAFGVINHIIGAERVQYKNTGKVQLLGTRYAILRKEFLQVKKKSSVKEKFVLERTLICLGGSDKNQVTNKIVRNLLADWPQLNISVLVGASFVGYAELNQYAAAGRITILKEKSAAEIIEAVSQASVAIITPGMISYEFFSVGIPALCGYISEYQQQVLDQFSTHSLVMDIADFNREKLNFALRSMTALITDKQLEAQRVMFDGQSGDRLVKAFQEIYDGA